MFYFALRIVTFRRQFMTNCHCKSVEANLKTCVCHEPTTKVTSGSIVGVNYFWRIFMKKLRWANCFRDGKTQNSFSKRQYLALLWSSGSLLDMFHVPISKVLAVRTGLFTCFGGCKIEKASLLEPRSSQSFELLIYAIQDLWTVAFKWHLFTFSSFSWRGWDCDTLS